jgi:glycine cleavage system aminomethyltransferase T
MSPIGGAEKAARSSDPLSSGTEVEVTILGSRRSAKVVEAQLYDPKNERLLS